MCKLVFHVNQSCVNRNSQRKWGWVFLSAATCNSQAMLYGLLNLLQTSVPHSVSLSCLLNIYQTFVPHSVSLSSLLNISYQTPVPHSVSLSSHVSKDKTAPYTAQQLQLTLAVHLEVLANSQQVPIPYSTFTPYFTEQLEHRALLVHLEVLANSQQVPIPYSTFTAHPVLTLQNSSPRTLLAELQVPVNS